MRAAVPPSQPGIGHVRLARPSRISSTERRTSSASRPTSRFVPRATVTGRSVLRRRVRHGTSRIVVSACTPPGVRHHASRVATGTGTPGSPAARSARARGSIAVRTSRPARARRGACAGDREHDRARSARARLTDLRSRSSSTLLGRCIVTRRSYGASSQPADDVRGRARSRYRSSVSIMTLPTRWIRTSGTPSRRRLSTPAARSTKSRSETRSVSTPVDLLGHLRSKLRRPASTCATGAELRGHQGAGERGVDVADTRRPSRAAASSTTASKRTMISAVCTACDPDPTSRW